MLPCGTSSSKLPCVPQLLCVKLRLPRPTTVGTGNESPPVRPEKLASATLKLSFPEPFHAIHNWVAAAVIAGESDEVSGEINLVVQSRSSAENSKFKLSFPAPFQERNNNPPCATREGGPRLLVSANICLFTRPVICGAEGSPLMLTVATFRFSLPEPFQDM